MIFVVGVEVYFWLHQNRNCSHHKVFGFQQLCVDYFSTRDKTQHMTSGTLSVEADCSRKLEKQLPLSKVLLCFDFSHCYTFVLHCD